MTTNGKVTDLSVGENNDVDVNIETGGAKHDLDAVIEGESGKKDGDDDDCCCGGNNVDIDLDFTVNGTYEAPKTAMSEPTDDETSSNDGALVTTTVNTTTTTEISDLPANGN